MTVSSASVPSRWRACDCISSRQYRIMVDSRPETADEPPEAADARDKLAKRALDLEAARDRAVADVRKHLKALLAPAARAGAGKVD